jgi:tetratricopeptide (TPR) repeat protein
MRCIKGDLFMPVKSNGKFLACLGIALALIFILAIPTIHHWRKNRHCGEDLSPLPRIKQLIKEGGPVFISPEFVNHVAHDSSALIPTFDEAIRCQEAATFYSLNRERHFKAIFLGNRPSSLPLVRALLSSPLWVLGDVLPGGYVFLPLGRAAWSLPDEESLRKSYPDPHFRARWLIGTASSLIPIGRTLDAEKLLEMAAGTKKETSRLLATKASLAASRGDWSTALELSKKSHDLDDSDLMSSMIEIRALTECGRADEALELARNLVGRSENQETLFLLARAANAANSNTEEIEALQRVAIHARRERQSLGVILTYLGQAYAKKGNRGEALRTFQEAIAAPELTDEQRRLLRVIMDHLMEGNAPSTSLPPLQQDVSDHLPGKHP